jgi:hypothetical protein
MATMMRIPSATERGRSMEMIRYKGTQARLQTPFYVFALVIATLVLTLSPGTGSAQSEVVVPNAQATVEGNENFNLPFAHSRRFQQVYSASEIIDAGIIDKIAFRPDFVTGRAFAITGVSVKISLSHTPKPVDGLSATFADNVGSDETVVLDTTNLSYSSSKANCGAAGPCDFDIEIDLDDVFEFNGQDNLLLDVSTRQGNNTSGPFDAQFTTGDGVSSGFGETDNLADLTADFIVTRGLVTKFYIVPEPVAVDIDIKPGSDPNCFNADDHGVIPVAILGSADFDASTVDPTSIFLDGAGVRVKGKSGNAGSLEDVNNDGFEDLVVQIEDADGTFEEGDTVATLTGNLKEEFGGTPIEGTDTICIVP